MNPRSLEIIAELIPEVPMNVSLNDLDVDLYLVTKATRDKILSDAALAMLGDGRIKKQELQIYLNEKIPPGDPTYPVNYDILKIDGEYYALYHGVKYNTQKGTGYSGVGKSAQNLRTGAWIVPKVISEYHREHNSNILEQRSEQWFEQEKQASRKEFAINKAMGLNVGDKPLPERAVTSKGRQFTIPLQDAGIDLFLYFYNLKSQGVTLHPAHLTDIFIQIADGLEQLHTNAGYLHLDLKCENILINPNTGKVTIIDFGSAIPAPLPGQTVVINRVAGTPYTRAPETNMGEYSTQSDSFSFGATMAT